jgi:hypothetical protein
VVERSGNDNLLIPLDTTILTLNGNLLNRTNGQDTRLRGVDDSSEPLDGRVHSHVGDGESAALVLLGLELSVAGLASKRLDVLGDGDKTLRVRVLNDGGHQADRGGDGDRDVRSGELLDDALGLTVRAVDLGDLEQRRGDSLNQEVVDRQLVFSVGRGVEGLAELEELADGKSALHVVVRVGVLRLSQALRNNLAHGGQGDVDAGGSSSGSGSGLEVLDIGLGDSATRAGPLNLLEWDSLLQSEGLGRGGRVEATLSLKNGLELALKAGLLGGLGDRSGGGLGRRLLGLLLLLGGSSRLSLSAGVGNAKFGKGRNILTLLNDDGDGLHHVSAGTND